MAGLGQLPDELAVQILSYLDVERDQPTIAALRGANRQLRRLSESQRSVAVLDGDYSSTDQPCGKPLARRALKVKKQPEFRWMLKRLYTGSMNNDNDAAEDSESSAVSFEADPAYKALLEQADVSHQVLEEVLFDIAMGTPRGYLLFLLAVCPIEVFTARQTLDRTGTAMRVMLTAPSRPLRKLQLTEYKMTLVCVAQASTFLSLPNLHVLKLADLSDSGDWWFHTALPKLDGPCNARPISLEFDTCMVTGAGLECLLAACATPYSLAIRWRPGNWNWDGKLTVSSVGDAIRKHGVPLRHLLLDTTAIEEESRHAGMAKNFGSFDTLSCLRSLALPLSAFDDHQVDPAAILPPSLEELFILGVGRDLRREWNAEQRRELGNETEIGSGSTEDNTTEAAHREDVSRRYEEGDLVFVALEASKDRLPHLRRVVKVPWAFYSVWDRFEHRERCVDYDQVKELAFRNTRKDKH